MEGIQITETEFRELYEITNELFPIIEKGNCVVWIGSGLSERADYPSWPELIRTLCHNCVIIPDHTIEDSTPSDILIEIADRCKSENITEYHRTLANTFGHITTVPLTFSLLMNLPFKGYVTTNFEPLLSFSATYSQRGEFVKLCAYPGILQVGLLERDNTVPVFYIHGHAMPNGIPRGENLILTKSDFKNAYEVNQIVSSFLNLLLSSYDVIFIGCGLREEKINVIFSRVRDIHNDIKRIRITAKTPNRYIILSKEYKDNNGIPKRDIPKETEQAKLYEELDINVIRYSSNGKDYREIDKILEELCTKFKKPAYQNIFYGLEEVEPL